MIAGAFLRGATLALALASAGAFAQEQPAKQPGTLTIDPQAAYIFFRSREHVPVSFVREVTEARRPQWAAERAAALARARAVYERRAPQWRREEAQCRGSPAVECTNRPPMPVMPTEENFDYGPLVSDDMLTIAPTDLGGNDRLGYFFAAVEPGSYILYGQTSTMPGAGSTGVCLCMGSIRFEVAAGQIVDMGELRYPRDEAGQEEPTYGPQRLASMEVVPANPSMAVPEGLAGHALTPALLRAAGKMPNYYGIEIDRLPPIPGVLGYERDRVIDLRTGQPVAP